MPAGHGLRSRTRDSFSRAFRGKGFIPLSTYLRTYKLGDYVDIKVNSAVHKGKKNGGANESDLPPPPLFRRALLTASAPPQHRAPHRPHRWLTGLSWPGGRERVLLPRPRGGRSAGEPNQAAAPTFAPLSLPRPRALAHHATRTPVSPPPSHRACPTRAITAAPASSGT